MSAEEVLENIRKEIIKKSPKEAKIVDVQFEGPEVVVYVKNPEIFTNEIIKSLAKDLRKRISIRPDPSVLVEPEIAKQKILEIVPEEAEITNFVLMQTLGKS